MIKNLTESEALELLKVQKFGHLGCVLGSGDPYVLPINYLFKDDEIYIHTLPGKKIDVLRENGKLCLQVEQIENSFRWKSVIVIGEFQEIKKINEKIEILNEFSVNFKQLTPVEAMLKDNWNSGGIIVFRLNIKQITGMTES